MESHITVFLVCSSFFIVLVFIELLYGRFVKNQKQNLMKNLGSLSMGPTNVLMDSLGLVLVLVSYHFY